MRWKPNVTVAAIVERGGKYLLVEERSAEQPSRLLLNNPAGHLEPGESLIDACVRETLEETTCAFTPTALVGIYLARPAAGGQTAAAAEHEADVTYLRFAFTGTVGEPQADRTLDIGIERTVWLALEEIHASQDRHTAARCCCAACRIMRPGGRIRCRCCKSIPRFFWSPFDAQAKLDRRWALCSRCAGWLARGAAHARSAARSARGA